MAVLNAKGWDSDRCESTPVSDPVGGDERGC